MECLTLFTSFSGDNNKVKIHGKCGGESPNVSKFLLIRNKTRPPDNWDGNTFKHCVSAIYIFLFKKMGIYIIYTYYIQYNVIFLCFLLLWKYSVRTFEFISCWKKKITSWTVLKTNIFGGVWARVCIRQKQQPWGLMVERNAARESERSWRAGRWNLSSHHPRPLTVRTILAVELWTWGQELSKLERKDGKPACLPWTHRQRRGRAEVEPGRQGRMLPGPQQWLGAGRLLSLCAVSRNPNATFLVPKWHLFSYLEVFFCVPRMHVDWRIIKMAALPQGQTSPSMCVDNINAKCSNEEQKALLFS